MSRRKTGLHKNISSIFKGVPVQRADGTAARSDTSAPEPPKPTFSRLPVLEPQDRQAKDSQQPKPAPPPPCFPAKARRGKAPARQASPDRPAKTAGPNPWQKVWEQIKNKLPAPKQGISTKRQKTMAIVVPILFLALIIMLTRALSTPSPGTAVKPAGFGPSAAVAAGTTSGNEIDWQMPEPYPTTLRDPTQFGSTAADPGQGGKLIVRGIVYSEDNPSAVIGTTIVRIGDKIAGATIVKINENSVEFEMEGNRWTQQVQR